MSRTVFPLVAKDVSLLARSLTRELEARETKPSHVEMLNILARSAGYRNFQHLRAESNAQDRLQQLPIPPEPVEHGRVLRVSRHFDARAVLLRWPKKASERQLCLWVLWSIIPSGRCFSEAEINDILTVGHVFGDHALLRRALCDNDMMSRTIDCREYRRREQRPPTEALALIRHLGLRRTQ